MIVEDQLDAGVDRIGGRLRTRSCQDFPALPQCCFPLIPMESALPQLRHCSAARRRRFLFASPTDSIVLYDCHTEAAPPYCGRPEADALWRDGEGLTRTHYAAIGTHSACAAKRGPHTTRDGRGNQGRRRALRKLQANLM
jgi:hypothetical protein